MKRKHGRGRGLRALAWLLSILLFFSLGMLAGIRVERSGLLGGGNSENENTAGQENVTGENAEAGAKAPAEASDRAAPQDEASEASTGETGADPGTGADGRGVDEADAGNGGAGTSGAGAGADSAGAGEAGTAGAGTSEAGAANENTAGQEADAGTAGTDAGKTGGSGANAGAGAAGTGAEGTKSAEADAEGTNPSAGTNSSDGETDASADKASQIEAKVEEMLAAMPLEDKVAQLFFVTPDALTGVSDVTRAGDTTQSAFDRRPVGGIVLFENNISGPDQLSSFTEGITQISMDRAGVIPFIAVDEEGGTVLRIAKNGNFGLNETGRMADVGATGNPAEANAVGSYIGSYLADYGINVDFAPTADVLTNPENTVVRDRAFGSDGDAVAGMVAECVRGLTGYGVSATLKHFPGHGSTTGDSHKGAAVSYRTMDELRETDLKPFAAGIEAGAEFVMAGHISFPNVDTGEDVPATISRYFLTDILRSEMGFEGIILTDALNMQAITDYYSSGDAAIKAINAGVDMILMPASFGDAYSAVQSAAQDGRITEERIDESVRRILRVKLGKMTAES